MSQIALLYQAKQEYTKLNGLSGLELAKYYNSPSVTNVLHVYRTFNPETLDLVRSCTTVDDLITYQGNTKYTVVNNMLQPIVDYFIKTDTMNYNVIHYMKKLKVLVDFDNQEMFFNYLKQNELDDISSTFQRYMSGVSSQIKELEYREQLASKTANDFKHGDFSFLYDDGFSRKTIEYSYIAILELKLISFFQTKLPMGQCYQFCKNDEINQFSNHELIKNLGHSGASFEWSCQVMHNIATKGWLQYVSDSLNNSYLRYTELKNNELNLREALKLTLN